MAKKVLDTAAGGEPARTLEQLVDSLRTATEEVLDKVQKVGALISGSTEDQGEPMEEPVPLLNRVGVALANANATVVYLDDILQTLCGPV